MIHPIIKYGRLGNISFLASVELPKCKKAISNKCIYVVNNFDRSPNYKAYINAKGGYDQTPHIGFQEICSGNQEDYMALLILQLSQNNLIYNGYKSGFLS
jgi:hypothetical protein